MDGRLATDRATPWRRCTGRGAAKCIVSKLSRPFRVRCAWEPPDRGRAFRVSEPDAADMPLTDEPDLHLLADGRQVDGNRRPNGDYVFDLPRCPSELRVLSRSGSPAELGLVRDPRVLGVAVRQIRMWQGRRLRLLDAADESFVEGFHAAFEPDNGFRWTDGNAALPATLTADIRGACQLELLVGATAARYPLRVGWACGSIDWGCRCHVGDPAAANRSSPGTTEIFTPRAT